MKKIILLLTIFTLFSCADDFIVYKNVLPKNKINYVYFPKSYMGTYVNKTNNLDTLFVGYNDFYYKLKPTESGKENVYSRKGKISSRLVIRSYKNGLFLNVKRYKSSVKFNGRFVLLKDNTLYVYKLVDKTNLQGLVYDYSYDNKNKQYTINPTNLEFDKLFIGNHFKLSKTLRKINSIPYKPNSTNTTTSKTGCLSGNCVNGYGIYKYTNGDSYFGFFSNGKRHGYGEYLWGKTKDYYSGNWENDLRSGYGEQLWKASRSGYFGKWKNGVRNGNGYVLNSNLSLNIGRWKNDLLSYKLNYTINNGKTIGCVKGNCVNGYGNFKWVNGNFYKGFFLNGKRISGTFTYKNGDKYHGEFNTTGQLHGMGFYFFKNGNKYKGNWQNGKRHGFGVLKYNKGKTYYENYNKGVKISSKEQKIN